MAQGRAQHAKHVLYGAVDPQSRSLTLTLLKVEDGSVLWSNSWPVAGADPAAIAAEADAQVNATDSN